MKKFSTVFAILFTLVFCLVASAQTPDQDEPVDSLRLAQVIGGLELVFCNGDFNYHHYIEGVNQGQLQGNLETTPEGVITYLEIGGVVIVEDGEEPVRSLPFPSEGEIRYLNVWISCYGQVDGFPQQRASGHIRFEVLAPGAPIVVELAPTRVLAFVACPECDGFESPVLEFVGGSPGTPSWRFQESARGVGGFYVYVDPVSTTPYEVYNSDGTLVTTGVIDVLDDSDGKGDPNSHLSYSWGNGVRALSFLDRTQYLLRDQEMDGVVDGEDGKVYVLEDLAKRSFWLELEPLSGAVFSVTVYRWQRSGEMEMLRTTADSRGGDWLFVDGGYDTVLVELRRREGLSGALRYLDVTFGVSSCCKG